MSRRSFFQISLPLLSVLPNTDAKLFSVTNGPFVITGLVVGLTVPKPEKYVSVNVKTIQ